MQKRKGISLIVLVITIIVMIVLAGAIILTLNNSGIIGMAQNAVDSTNEATIKEVASLAWAEAYANGARTEDELKAGVLASFEKNKINTEGYIVEVTTSGVTVKDKANIWIQKGFTVVKGNQVLEIGDSIAYDETAGGTKTVATNVDWKVLGADEEGNLLIMSASDVKSSFYLGDETQGNNLKEAISDYETGVKQLNDECLPYGYGKGTVGQARSITVEDINKVTGYDPTTYGKGTLEQYGNVVTYSYNGTTKPAYSSAVASGILTAEHNNEFYYYNGKTVEHINNLTTGTSGEEFATLTSNYYNYNARNLTTISKESNAKSYSMIFGEYDEDMGVHPDSYWLASSYVRTGTYSAELGLFILAYEYVGDNISYAYHPNFRIWSGGIRAVVTLSSDITFTGSSEAGWNY